jgi:hypothetical protein
MRSYTEGSHVFHSQGVFFDGLPTYGVLSDNIAPAENKYHLYLRNDAGSNQTVWILALYFINVQVSSATGTGVLRCDFRRVSGTPTMTSLTPFPFNTADPALTGVTAGHTVTAGLTDEQLLFPFVYMSLAHSNIAYNMLALVDFLNRLGLAHPYMRPLALRPGEAVALKQTTAISAGSFASLVHFSVEPD